MRILTFGRDVRYRSTSHFKIHTSKRPEQREWGGRSIYGRYFTKRRTASISRRNNCVRTSTITRQKKERARSQSWLAIQTVYWADQLFNFYINSEMLSCLQSCMREKRKMEEKRRENWPANRHTNSITALYNLLVVKLRNYTNGGLYEIVASSRRRCKFVQKFSRLSRRRALVLSSRAPRQTGRIYG